MLGTRQLAEILRHTTAAGAKLVLTGDHRQLPELEAGGCFRGLAIRLPYIGLARQPPAARRVGASARCASCATATSSSPRPSTSTTTVSSSNATPPRLGERLVADWWSSGGPERAAS